MAAAAAAAGARAAARAYNEQNSYSMYRHDKPLKPSLRRSDFMFTPIDWITVSCMEKGDKRGQNLVLPRSFKELRQIGVTKYGASFVRVLDVRGAEINDIRVVRVIDRIDFASHEPAEEESSVRVTITCLEKGDNVAEELLVLPRYTLEELREVGVERYGASFTRVLSEEGYEINDIRVVRDGDHIVFARQAEEPVVRVLATCLEKGDAEGRLLVVPRCLGKLKEVGVKIYGAPFVRVLSEDGNEIDDIRVVKNWDRVVFASPKPAEEASSVRVIITCLEKGDDDAEEVLVLLSSLEDLKRIGVEKYGASFTRVLNEEGDEINDINEVRYGDRIVFASQKRVEESGIHVMFKCLEKGDNVLKLLRLPRSLEELKGVGVNKYGARFVRVLNKQGDEINDIRELRNYDSIVFASPKVLRVMITCPEKGDDVGKLMVLPHSFEELKWVGVKIYGASFVRVFTKKGNEINDISEVRDDSHILFASNKPVEESNELKREELNESDRISCLAMLSEMWRSIIKTYKFNLFGK